VAVVPPKKSKTPGALTEWGIGKTVVSEVALGELLGRHLETVFGDAVSPFGAYLTWNSPF
jgi:hypothetical protein